MKTPVLLLIAIAEKTPPPGFAPRDEADSLLAKTRVSRDLPSLRVSAHDAMAIAVMTLKPHVDKKHRACFFAVSDRMFLRLRKAIPTRTRSVTGSGTLAA